MESASKMRADVAPGLSRGIIEAPQETSRVRILINEREPAEGFIDRIMANPSILFMDFLEPIASGFVVMPVSSPRVSFSLHPGLCYLPPLGLVIKLEAFTGPKS